MRLPPSWLRAAYLCCSLLVVACSGGGQGGGRGTDDGDKDSGPSTGDGDTNSMGDGDLQLDNDAGEDASTEGCKKACDPDDCGNAVFDLCGGFLTCGACTDGKVCGVLRADKCDFPPPEQCTPIDPVTACAGKCGTVSNGCSGIITCDQSNQGVVCDAGEFCENEACAPIPDACEITPENEACAGKCGVVSNNCGDVYVCNTSNNGVACGAGQKCDETIGSATRNQCISLPLDQTCTALTAAAACTGTCGIVSDGCGGNINCETVQGGTYKCPNGTTCGGAGVPGQCGQGSGPDPSTCTPVAQACAGKCDWVSDGCSGPGYTCGAGNGGDVCQTSQGEVCIANECENTCVAKTAAQVCPAAKGCGLVGNGCGGTINCGTCTGGQVCGLGGVNTCGTPTVPPCTVPANFCTGKCGVVATGCHTTPSIDCGLACPNGQTCGATQANSCGTPPTTPCTARTCQELGHSCGVVPNGCGGQINCWSGCTATDLSCTGSCGTSAACVENAQGKNQCLSGGPGCVGSLCDDLPTCANAAATKLTGTVRTPGRQNGANWVNQLPVPNALVYIPADPGTALPSIFEGVSANNPASCGRCDDEKLVADGQSVLAAAVTNASGTFTLEGRIPVGQKFNLVIKIGKWRRVVEVPATVAACGATRAIDAQYTYLAKSSADGLFPGTGTHLPKIAVSTGEVDEMECVLRNMGIAESEFTVPSGSGRIHMYRANGARMGSSTTQQVCSPSWCSNSWCNSGTLGCGWQAQTSFTDNSVNDTTLFASQAAINAYDMVVFDCEGEESRHSGNPENYVANYVNAGGRMFASHFSYVWIENHSSLSPSAAWGPTTTDDSATGYLSMLPGRTGANGVKSELLRDWLNGQGALTSTNPPQLTIADPRDRAGATVGASTDEWLYRNLSVCSNNTNRKCSSKANCRTCSNDSGRFCTGNNDCSGSGTCRAEGHASTGECSSVARVQQLSFNTPYGANSNNICGRVTYSGFHVANADNDGNDAYFPGVCGNGELTAQEKVLAFMLFDLATCVSDGDPPQPPECTPKTAAQVCPGVNDACGYLSDGCGGVVNCAGCSPGYYCDGTTCRPQECTPATCTTLGFNCGNHADGCGGIARNSAGQPGCGDCTSGQVCGLGGPGLCGAPTCTPIPFNTACPTNSCGQASNGCGGTHNCGTCINGQICGGAGPNLCGGGQCTKIPKATACLNKTCGSVSDGCGGSYDCGTCVAPDSCGGGGQANVCGHPVCNAYTKDQACNGLQCGWVSDGCGGAINCGTCPDGRVCGGAGPNLCGSACDPLSCSEANAQCGAIADGCGAILGCGECPNGQTCGAAGPNRCGTGQTCVKRTCQNVQAECGLIGDGCGGVLDCGPCTVAGESCGGSGTPNQCGPGMGGCNKQTCEARNVECGATSDGCGGLLDCGGCPVNHVCKMGACEELLIIE